MTARRYKKVPQVEVSESDESRKKITAERMEEITTKLHALLWLVAAIVVAIYSDIVKVCLKDSRVNRGFLNTAVVLFVANIGIALYLTLWLPLVQKVTVSWEVYCPRMIPTATLLGTVCIVFSMIAFWPVYGFLTPLIVSILLLGLLFSTHFIPWPC